MIITFQNFAYTVEADQILIWQWRNSDRVRRRMINQDFIELKSHLDWVAGLIHRGDCSYFLVHDDGKPIGVLDFTEIDRNRKTAEWGFYLDTNTRPGFGIIGFLALEHFFNDWSFIKMYSQILVSNEKSYEWHKKLLFSSIRGHPETGNDIFSMVLKREVWLGNSRELRVRLFSNCPICRAIWQE